MPTKSKKKKGRKQNDLPGVTGPGVEKVIIKEIDDIASTCAELDDKIEELARRKKERYRALLELMREHKLEVYEFDEFKVKLKHGSEKVEIKRVSADGSKD